MRDEIQSSLDDLVVEIFQHNRNGRGRDLALDVRDTLHVLLNDVRQVDADLDARHFNTEHGFGMLPRESGVLVRADRSRLRGPEDVHGTRHQEHRISLCKEPA